MSIDLEKLADKFTEELSKTYWENIGTLYKIIQLDFKSVADLD